VTDFSGAACDRALEAVVDASMPGERFTFIATGGAGYGTLYVAAHPERVERLITLDPIPATSAWFNATTGDWSVARRAMASMVFPAGPPERQRWWSEALRDSISQTTLQAAISQYRGFDMHAAYARVRVPTLFVTGKREALRQHASRLAAVVPGSRLVNTEDTGPAVDDRDAVRAILEFMGIDPACVGEATPAASTAIILFVDIAGSTALTERIGDAAFRTAARTVDERVRTAMRDAGGTPVEGRVLGDGVMGVFASAAQAIAAARACVSAAQAADLPLHIGVHAGDVLREENNVYGGAVNIASRICGMSEPGEVLVSATIRDLARTSAGVVFEDRGEHALKGIDDPVRVFAVRVGAV
jgi:class 3 adenylate cyclase